MEIELNTERFLALLEKFIGESQYVQNMPPQYIPQESRVVNHILPLFEPHLAPNGPITLQVRLFVTLACVCLNDEARV